MVPEVRSYKGSGQSGKGILLEETGLGADLLQEIRGQHKNLGVWAVTLNCTEVSNALLVVLWRGHDLKDVEGGPGHVVTHHFEVDELEQGGGLDVCPVSSDSHTQHPAQRGYRLTHVLAADLCTAFFQTVLNVFLLVPLVIPQASDEVVEGFLEPAIVSAATLFRS